MMVNAQKDNIFGKRVEYECDNLVCRYKFNPKKCWCSQETIYESSKGPENIIKSVFDISW